MSKPRRRFTVQATIEGDDWESIRRSLWWLAKVCGDAPIAGLTMLGPNFDRGVTVTVDERATVTPQQHQDEMLAYRLTGAGGGTESHLATTR